MPVTIAATPILMRKVPFFLQFINLIEKMEFKGMPTTTFEACVADISRKLECAAYAQRDSFGDVQVPWMQCFVVVRWCRLRYGCRVCPASAGRGMSIWQLKRCCLWRWCWRWFWAVRDRGCDDGCCDPGPLGGGGGGRRGGGGGGGGGGDGGGGGGGGGADGGGGGHFAGGGRAGSSRSVPSRDELFQLVQLVSCTVLLGYRSVPD